MSTKQEEKDEQSFFLGKVKEQEQDERKHTMAVENDKPKAGPKPTEIPVYTGKTGGPYERPKYASKEAVVSDAGVTEPTPVFGGDGLTPIIDWEKSQEERRKKQDEFDEKRRQRAVEDAGVIQTTEKYRHAAIVAAEERRHAEAERHEQAEAEAEKHHG